MKRTLLLILFFFAICSGSIFAQFVVKPTFFETQGVSNDGVISGYEAQAGPYSIWNPDSNTFYEIGGAAPGQGVGGAARFSGDGTLLSGTSYETIITPTEWEKLNTGYNYIFTGIEFPDNQNSLGFAAGQSVTYNGDGIILRTYDAGDSWDQLWTGTNQGIEGISFPDSYTGFVVGWSAYAAKTTDAGNSWTPITPGTDIMYYTDVVFKDTQNGIVGAFPNNSPGAIYYTSDGGVTWTQSTGVDGTPDQLTYVGGDTYFMASTGGNIQKSIDNGATWTTVLSAAGTLAGIEFYDMNTGFAVGDDVVLKTTDGGATWQTITVANSPGPIWRDVAWADADHVTLIGTPEMIFNSEDGGETFPINNLNTSTFNESLFEVVFTPNGRGFIFGSQGVMFRKEPESNIYSIQSMYNVADDEWTVLGSFGVPSDISLSSGYNISADGSTVVGSASVEPTPGEPGTAVHATAWTATDGLVDLGSLYQNINRSTRANAVSGDGNIIVGWQDFNGPWKSAVWRKDVNGNWLPNEYLLIDPTGDPTDEYNQLGECMVISTDGNWIGGRGDYANNYEPWLWSESTGYVGLGTIAPGSTGTVTGINHDGTIVVGYFQGGPFDPIVPYIWTPNFGMQELNNFVTEQLGYTITASPIYVPSAMSANGKFITGWGYDDTIGPWGDLFTYRIQLPIVPTNDDCVEAIALQCGDLVTNSTIFGTDSGGNASPDVFYSYTGNGVAETITLNACGPDTNFSTTVRVFSDCSLTTQIAFNDSSCVNQPELEFESDGTSTYFIMIEGYDDEQLGNFQLELTCEALGLNDNELTGVVFYPNPVLDVLQISGDKTINSVEIFNVSGQRLILKNLNSMRGEINLSSLTSGIYFAKVMANNAVGTYKIVKS
ncbi:MAG: hypothetical protein CL526_01015 [Aequorivita sp.]|nr:hypothetical protein [Aequorivita sp.]|tara:strand:- start:77590 stop:80244 length:2655 start_codon:yes stop_codon:yes gene_type:complete